MNMIELEMGMMDKGYTSMVVNSDSENELVVSSFLLLIYYYYEYI